MKYWSQKQTRLFKKCVYNLEGLDRLNIPVEGAVGLFHMVGLGFILSGMRLFSDQPTVWGSGWGRTGRPGMRRFLSHRRRISVFGY